MSSQSINGLFHLKKPFYNTSIISSMINFSFFGGISPHFLGVHVAGCDLTWAQCCVGEDLTTPVPAPVGNLVLQVMMNQLLILFF